MTNKKPEETFRVVDRRLFTPDGELRQESVERERQQDEAAGKPAAAAKDAPAAPTAPAPAVEPPKRSPAFENLIRMMASNAAMVLGAYADPRTGQPIIEPEAAREIIDMLDALHEKTRGNLAPEEEQLLLDLSGKLKITYLEISQATVQAMHAKAKTRG